MTAGIDWPSTELRTATRTRVYGICPVDTSRPARRGEEESVRLSAWTVSEWHGRPANVAPDEHGEIGWFLPEEFSPFGREIFGPALVDALRGTGT